MNESAVRKLYDRFTQWLWSESIDQGPWYQRYFIATIRLAVALCRDLANGHLSLRATSLVYTTLISLVPLLAFSFSVLKGFGVHNQLEPSLLNLLEPLGDQRFGVVKNVIGFVDNVKVGVLGTVGLAILLYSVIAMMHKVESAFNYTWRIRKGRSLTQRFSHYLSVIMVGPLLIFLSMGVTSAAGNHKWVEFLSTLPVMSLLVKSAGFILPWLFMALAFTFIYIFIPNNKVFFRSAFAGGLFSTVVWKLMGYLFSHFISGQSQQTLIYSAFASAILFIFWMYLGWLTLLAGATVAFYHQNSHYQQIQGENVNLTVADEERLILKLTYLIARRFSQGNPGWTAGELAIETQQPQNLIDLMITKLVVIGFANITADENSVIQPARSLKYMKVADVLASWVQLKGCDEFTECSQEIFFQPAESYIEKRQQMLMALNEKLTYEQWVSD